MKGRDKCELLNKIRQKIANENNIELIIYDCTFEGDCTGTCPKCEAELKYLEAELARKQAAGEKIKLNGIFTLELLDDKPTCDFKWDDEPLMGDIIDRPYLEGLPAEPDFIDRYEELGDLIPPEKLKDKQDANNDELNENN